MSTNTTIEVDVQCNSCKDPQGYYTDPTDLSFFIGGSEVSEIDFSEENCDIKFVFPTGYSAIDIRVFEHKTKDKKKDIMHTYKHDSGKAITKFTELWDGYASQMRKGFDQREFTVESSNDNVLVVSDLDQDGSKSGKLHDFILKFGYSSANRAAVYLFDPQIRNVKH